MDPNHKILDLHNWYRTTFRRPLAVVLILFALLEVALLADWSQRIRRDESKDLDQTASNLAQALNQKNRDLLITLGVSSAERLKADSWTLCQNQITLFSVPDSDEPCRRSISPLFQLRRERELPAHPDTKLVVISSIIPNPESFVGLLLTSVVFALLLFQQGRWLYRRLKSDIVDAIAERLNLEVPLPIAELESIRLSNREKIATAMELVRQESLASLSRQVAHDVRSPLAVLNMVIDTLPGVPEERRGIIRNATQRINDITNQLLLAGKENRSSGILERKLLSSKPVLLVSLLEEILSEKRVQFRKNHNIEIQGDTSEGYGLFSKIVAPELSRALSNLINNAVEAMPAGGVVKVGLYPVDAQSLIQIQDNGLGIPEEILPKLGEKGFSYGKRGGNSGTGLGVYHAKKTIEEFGGTFEASSIIGRGTTISLRLPRASAPDSFVSSIELSESATVVSFDDDGSIHQVWKERLEKVRASDSKLNIEHLSFSSAAELEKWILSTSKAAREKMLFLLDYELSGSNENGLHVAERFEITRQSILVTSRHEEKHVREQATLSGIKIISKSLAHLVPIVIKHSSLEADAIQIEDDAPIRQMWADVAKKKRKNLRQFSTPQEFLAAAATIERRTPLYIDVHLQNEARGEELARTAYDLGFYEIYLSTGYSTEGFKKPDFIKEVRGKYPPWI